VTAQKNVSYELNASMLFPLGNFADTHSVGMEFSFIEHITTDISRFHMVVGINYAHLPGKTVSIIHKKETSKMIVNWKDLEFIKLFIGYQFFIMQVKGCYLMPLISCSFVRSEPQWFRSGVDIGTGYTFPVRKNRMKIDVGTRLSFLNIYGKVRDENGRLEKNHNVISLSVGLYF
jgi:hypothetical protein